MATLKLAKLKRSNKRAMVDEVFADLKTQLGRDVTSVIAKQMKTCE